MKKLFLLRKMKEMLIKYEAKFSPLYFFDFFENFGYNIFEENIDILKGVKLMRIGDKQVKELFLYGNIMGSDYAGGIAFDEGTEIVNLYFETKEELEGLQNMIGQFLNIYRKEEDANNAQ